MFTKMDQKALQNISFISKHISIILVIGILITDPVFSEDKKKDTPESLQEELEQVDDNSRSSQQQNDNKYVRRATVDMFEDLTLTPYWDLEMGTGETVLVDCGVFTAGQAGIKISWYKTDGTLVNETESDRIHSTVSTTNHPQDTKQAAYTVATLSVANLTLDDSGNYRCQAVDQSVENDTRSADTSIKIKVFDSTFLCGFEGPSLCGWNYSTSWRYHTGDDEETINMTKLRHDHTYGSSKHHGHMLSVDTQRDSINEPTTVDLISPMMPQHDKSKKCFEFWHICSGNIDEMRVSIHYPIPVEIKGNRLSKTISVHQDKEWHRSTFDITPQAWGYQILVEADLCKDTKCKATVAIDDLRIYDGECKENDNLPDKRLKARLVNGSSEREGRLEVLHDGRWGTVCSRNFGKNDSRVVCRMLGLSTDDPEFKRKAEFGRGELKEGGDYMVWAERLACDGDEEDLASCMSKGETWDTHNCSHDEDVAVICKEPIQPETTPAMTPTPASSTKLSTVKTTVPSTSPTTVVSSSASPTASSSTVLSSSSSSSSPSVSSSSTVPNTAQPVTFKPKPSSTDSPTTTTVTDPYQTEGTVSTTGLPLSHTASSGSHTGAAVGIIVALIIIALVSGTYCYKRKKYGHKSKYIVFSNPKYHKDNLPGNDISMDSPLTSSSLSILA